MKIFTNVTREYQGGITTTNNFLLSYLVNSKVEIVGLEFDTVRCRKGPIIIPELDQYLFEHYYLTIHDLPLEKTIKKARGIADLEKYYRPLILEIKKLLQSTKPDVVLINGTSYFPWLISLAASECSMPIVLRYHGVSTKETAHLPPRIGKLFSAMEKSFFGRVKTFIFPSDLCRDAVEKEIYQKKIADAQVIFNPVQVPKSQRKKRIGRKIAAVSRDSWVKNLDAFFKLHEILNKQNWKHAATIVSELKNPKKLPVTIKCFEPIRYDKLCQFYASQDLIIAPSRFETFGNVPMEAVCMGTPVLVSKNMGCAEVLISAGLDNMIADFSDLDEAALKIRELCGQKILSKKLNHIRGLLSSEIINKKILFLLKEAAGE